MKTFKVRLTIYLIILLFGVGSFIYYARPELLRPILPNINCSKFSGRQSYAWGGDLRKCQEANCGYVKTKEHRAPPNVTDGGWFEFKCIAK